MGQVGKRGNRLHGAGIGDRPNWQRRCGGAGRGNRAIEHLMRHRQGGTWHSV